MTIKTDICKAHNCEKLKDKKRGSAYCMMHRSRMSRYKSLEPPKKPELPTGIVYQCKYHGDISKDESYKNPKDGYYSCIKCRRNSDKKMMINNPTKNLNDYKKSLYIRNTTLNTTIKIDKNTYSILYKKQNGLCAICKQPETMKAAQRKNMRESLKKEFSKRMALDHCHTTNKIRGLLCHHCNVSLGGFKDSIDILKSAIQYLEESSNSPSVLVNHQPSQNTEPIKDNQSMPDEH